MMGHAIMVKVEAQVPLGRGPRYSSPNHLKTCRIHLRDASESSSLASPRETSASTHRCSGSQVPPHTRPKVTSGELGGRRAPRFRANPGYDTKFFFRKTVLQCEHGLPFGPSLSESLKVRPQSRLPDPLRGIRWCAGWPLRRIGVSALRSIRGVATALSV